MEMQIKEMGDSKSYMILTIQNKLNELSGIDEKISQKCEYSKILPLIESKANKKITEKLHQQIFYLRKNIENILNSLQAYFMTKIANKNKKEKVF